ncbi:MAG TPA: Rieske (2Fe-2S) protein [Candidatus Dormibacteraeota bacterium]
MRGAVERIAAFVDDVIHNRRPRRFNASGEEMEALRGAAALRSLQPGADLPDGDFIDRLGRQLRSQMESRSQPTSVTRRALLRTAGLAAAAGVAGAVIDRTIVSQPLDQRATLTPDHGTWRAVAALVDLPAGQARRFSSGPVEGVVVNDGGTIKAVSAVCTHQGCLLLLDAAAHRLRCPCHPSVFDVNGKLISYRLSTPPANLPALQARVRNGQIEVMVV